MTRLSTQPHTFAMVYVLPALLTLAALTADRMWMRFFDVAMRAPRVG
jgi:hypothetical protein